MRFEIVVMLSKLWMFVLKLPLWREEVFVQTVSLEDDFEAAQVIHAGAGRICVLTTGAEDFRQMPQSK